MAETGKVVENLVSRLRMIPDGEVAATARRAGVAYRQLMKLRAGQNADIRISTLEKLAQGIGTSMADLLGDDPAAAQRQPRISSDWARRVERLAYEASSLAAAAEKLAVVVRSSLQKQ